MQCIGGISILFVIYGMWWNFNPACNIFFQRYYIYSVYILLQFSTGQETRINETASPLLRARDEDKWTRVTFVTGKRRGLTNQHCLCYRQDMRNHEQITSLRVCQILHGKSCAFPSSKKICQVKKRVHLQQSGIISLAKSRSNLHQESWEKQVDLPNCWSCS
jgi:hypothetical protein